MLTYQVQSWWLPGRRLKTPEAWVVARQSVPPPSPHFNLCRPAAATAGVSRCMPRALAWAWLAAAATLTLARQGPDSENATLAEDGARGRVKRAGVPEAALADDGRSRREEPLYVEEPAWVLLDRRETLGPARQAVAAAVPMPAGVGDAFWVARGRRREMSASSASAEGPFWAARGRREMEFFWPTRGKRDQEEVMVEGAGEEEDAGLAGEWAASRDRRAGLRSYLASKSGGQFFVPARGKRGSPHAGSWRYSGHRRGRLRQRGGQELLGEAAREGPGENPPIASRRQEQPISLSAKALGVL
ncbi:uncharacterized protein LOC126173780 [Schistocerca cancellata]|uniref:uncharacterized protein LOC126173780 n=1 Tax=Schistocerca cancellata TaxID=274614 RepID=UPI0021188252|nr:uncharacterized protein LOC126173780 [Schistocerca cancellata]